MEEIFVDLRIHGTSMHWSQDIIIKNPPLKCIINNEDANFEADWNTYRQMTLTLLLDTLFIIIYLFSKPSVAWSSRISYQASNFRQGPDLLQSKSPLSFSHLKLGKHNPPLKNGNKDSKDRTVRKVPCLIRFNHFFALKQKFSKNGWRGAWNGLLANDSMTPKLLFLLTHDIILRAYDLNSNPVNISKKQKKQ